MMTSPRRVSRLLVGVLVLVVMSGAAAAQDATSVSLAKDLTQALDAKKLATIAAKDPSDPEAFVAAMYFSGSQLLVVNAKYSPAVLLVEKLDKKDYQEVYIDLNSAAKAGTRVFIEDSGADGLMADHAENKGFDSMESGAKRTQFDDDWRKQQKLSEADYNKLFADAEKVYSRLLQALLTEAKK